MNASGATVREVFADSRDVVGQLVQLAQHDLSEFRGTLPGPDGRYAADWLPLYFGETGRHAYVIERGGDLAGLTLTRPLPDGATSVVSFFVVRALRRQSVGQEAALALLRMRPGRWAIAFQEENPGAARFWRRVATAAVGDDWREERRPVPGGPALPPDTWVLLDTRPVT